MKSALSRKINAKSEAKIIHELKKETKMIEDKSNPVRSYNYSYLKEILEEKHLDLLRDETLSGRSLTPKKRTLSLSGKKF